MLIIFFRSGYGQYDKKDNAGLINPARELRQLISSDPHRPIYHFANPEGIAMPFDPNGGIYWNGLYQLGFIYQNLERGKREHFWGHAVSRDLFHWTLYPDMVTVKPGNIERGIFSGGAFISREGIPHGKGKSPYGVKVFCSPDGREETVIQYDPIAKEIQINFMKSSVHGTVEVPTYCIVEPEKIEGYGKTTSIQKAPFELKKGESLPLDIFIDRSVVEVFANGRQCMTQVVYPELKESTGVKIFTNSNPVTIENLEVYEMSETNAY